MRTKIEVNGKLTPAEYVRLDETVEIDGVLLERETYRVGKKEVERFRRVGDYDSAPSDQIHAVMGTAQKLPATPLGGTWNALRPGVSEWVAPAAVT